MFHEVFISLLTNDIQSVRGKNTQFQFMDDLNWLWTMKIFLSCRRSDDT